MDDHRKPMLARLVVFVPLMFAVIVLYDAVAGSAMPPGSWRLGMQIFALWLIPAAVSFLAARYVGALDEAASRPLAILLIAATPPGAFVVYAVLSVALCVLAQGKACFL